EPSSLRGLPPKGVWHRWVRCGDPVVGRPGPECGWWSSVSSTGYVVRRVGGRQSRPGLFSLVVRPVIQGPQRLIRVVELMGGGAVRGGAAPPRGGWRRRTRRAGRAARPGRRCRLPPGGADQAPRPARGG